MPSPVMADGAVGGLGVTAVMVSVSPLEVGVVGQHGDRVGGVSSATVVGVVDRVRGVVGPAVTVTVTVAVAVPPVPSVIV